jgi:multidrug efflux pump subunit AcrA (membrane-fusion protein)
MSSIDLSALRMSEPPPPMQKRPLGPRLLAAAALGLVLVVAATFVWPLLRPVRAVPTVRLEAVAAAAAPSLALAEAAGWVEPDPFPILVRPLVAGRLEQVPQLEGSVVEAGVTVLAVLASAPLQAQRERAAAGLAEREAELAVATARQRTAEAQLAQRAAIRTALADAQAQVAAKQARVVAAIGARDRAAADERSAVAARDAQVRLAEAGGSYAVARERAEAALAAATATAAAAARDVALAEQEAAAAVQSAAIARDVAADPVDLAGALAIAEAEVARARAMVQAARTELQIAEREAQWLTVRAPASGVVMKVLAMPGAIVGPDAEPILSLYDPRQLRARIDVPLGSVAGIRDGQRVEVRSEVLGSVVVQGRVQRVQRESDLLKNTLQVKVELVDPPALLRPETLCRARFLADAAGGEAGAAAAPSAFRLPQSAVQNGRVFVFDPSTGTARGIVVEVVQQDATSVVVRGELSVTQRAILVPVADGERVREESR